MQDAHVEDSQSLLQMRLNFSYVTPIPPVVNVTKLMGSRS
jgi:hypothetical protein